MASSDMWGYRRVAICVNVLTQHNCGITAMLVTFTYIKRPMKSAIGMWMRDNWKSSHQKTMQTTIYQHDVTWPFGLDNPFAKLKSTTNAPSAMAANTEAVITQDELDELEAEAQVAK